jgi:cutinase
VGVERVSASVRRNPEILLLRNPLRTVAIAVAVLTTGVVLMASTVVATRVGLPSASADPCPPIEVVFARGTGEPPGIGPVGQSFVDSLRGQVGGRTVGVYAVNYPASYDFLAAADGANDASGHIQYTVANCPDTRLVLGGYSQGAAVMDVITAVPFPALGFNSPMPADVADHVAAVVVFGNPSARVGAPLTMSPLYGAKSIDLCNAGDPICTNGNSIAAHTNYETVGSTSQAAGFAAGLL